MAVPHEVQLLRQAELSGVLRVAAIDHVADGRDAGLGVADEDHRTQPFDIDAGHLLAFAQIGERLGPSPRRDPIDDTAAGAAVIETKNKPRALGRATVDERIDAERPMGSNQAGRNALRVRKARPPYQRPVGKHPEIFLLVIETRVHRIETKANAADLKFLQQLQQTRSRNCKSKAALSAANLKFLSDRRKFE